MAEPNTTDAYIYGTISILIISLCSLGGAVTLPLLRRRSRPRWLQIFVALAVATLCADAILHMMPEILGVHDHEEHKEFEVQRKKRQAGVGRNGTVPVVIPDQRNVVVIPTGTSHEHDHHGTTPHSDEHGSEEGEHGEHAGAGHVHSEHDPEHHHDKYRGHLVKLTVVMAAIYGFYLFEMIATGIAEQRRKNAKKKNLKAFENGHVERYRLSPATGPVVPIAWTPMHHPEHMPGLPMYPITRPPSAPASFFNGTPSKMDVKEPEHQKNRSNLSHQEPLCCGFKPIALMILFGDAIHNFADGLAVGASFTKNNTSGLSTSLAIACHELPHELGDFAVLIGSGLSVPKALFLNFLSALTAFGGLYFGIYLGQDAGTRPWLFAIAAGMFIYIALVDMLHHLKESESDDPWFVQLFLQNIGFLIGWTIIFLIGWFEHDIKI